MCTARINIQILFSAVVGYFFVFLWTSAGDVHRAVFLNRRATARYQALVSIIPHRERFSWNLSFYFSKNFS